MTNNEVKLPVILLGYLFHQKLNLFIHKIVKNGIPKERPKRQN
jgi:hypothetical protein